MLVKVLKNEKDHLEVEIANVTIAELVRSELWNDSAVTAAAWKRDHPSKNPVLVVQTDGKKAAKKALTDSLERISKLNEKVMAEAKKALKK